MLPELRATLEALIDPARVVWTGEHPAPGAEPGPDELYISVGGRADTEPPHPRMLAWKLPQWRSANARCTADVVLASGDALDALRDRRPLRLTTHDPTLDTVVSTFLALHRILHGRFPAGSAALASYVGDWEQGRIETAGSYERSLAAVFYAALRLGRAPAGGPAPGVPGEVLQLIAEVLAQEPTRAVLADLPRELVPANVVRRLKADQDLYRAELSRARCVQLDLPLDASPDAPYRRVDAMFLSSMQDVTVLKMLARPDPDSSFYRHGFDVLVIHAPNAPRAYQRHTVSLAPERPGTLRPLAEVLDEKEGPQAPDGTLRARGKRRFLNQANDLDDPWYSDGYAWPRARSTIVAPPFVGSRLSREEIWETVWEQFNVGRHVKVLSAHTVMVRPCRLRAKVDDQALMEAGWSRSRLEDASRVFLPSVVSSFLGDPRLVDVDHYERPTRAAPDGSAQVLHLALYPNQLVLVWLERTRTSTTDLFTLARDQHAAAASLQLADLPELGALTDSLVPLVPGRWLVYGAYRIDRPHSTMIDASRSMLGLFHALASGTAPTLRELPSLEAAEGRRVCREPSGDVEHWFTSTGGARLEFVLEETAAAPCALDQDFLLFLLTVGQRYTVFEITHRMSEIERRSRNSRWQGLRPTGDVRGDVMLFITSLWYTRVSDDPDVNGRYLAWIELHGVSQNVEAMREQTSELDQFRKERTESMISLMVFVFLPVTIACGFFSGVQFEDMDLRKGLPWSTGGWVVFLIYTGVFTVLTFGTFLFGRLFSWRRR